MRQRLILFGTLCVLFAVLFGLYVQHRQRTRDNVPAAFRFVDDPSAIARAAARPHILFVNTTFDKWNNHVALAALDDPGGERYMTDLRCERVYATADVGMCLEAKRGMVTSYHAVVFDDRFQERARFPLPGTPSRTRVSPDGHVAATTVFIAGDSYAADRFSTRTSLYDLDRLAPLGDLEEFTVRRNGTAWREVDFNFWGVTFAREPGVFFATLASGGRIYLVQGRILSRELTVIDEAVECPSLSPDGLSLAFKLRKPGGVRLGWTLETLRLATGARAPLSERRSVDDQAEWLDGSTVLYSLPAEGGGSDVWSSRADDAGPALILKQGYSPSVLRR